MCDAMSRKVSGLLNSAAGFLSNAEGDGSGNFFRETNEYPSNYNRLISIILNSRGNSLNKVLDYVKNKNQNGMEGDGWVNSLKATSLESILKEG